MRMNKKINILTGNSEEKDLKEIYEGAKIQSKNIHEIILGIDVKDKNYESIKKCSQEADEFLVKIEKN